MSRKAKVLLSAIPFVVGVILSLGIMLDDPKNINAANYVMLSGFAGYLALRNTVLKD